MNETADTFFLLFPLIRLSLRTFFPSADLTIRSNDGALSPFGPHNVNSTIQVITFCPETSCDVSTCRKKQNNNRLLTLAVASQPKTDGTLQTESSQVDHPAALRVSSRLKTWDSGRFPSPSDQQAFESRPTQKKGPTEAAIFLPTPPPPPPGQNSPTSRDAGLWTQFQRKKKRQQHQQHGRHSKLPCIFGGLYVPFFRREKKKNLFLR